MPQLVWDLTAKAEQTIATALTNVRQLIDDICLHVTSHDAYGKVRRGWACAQGVSFSADPCLDLLGPSL